MLIFTQNRNKLINSNCVSYFDVDILGDGCSNTVYANFENDSPIELGTYITKEEAYKLLDKIAETEGALYVSKEEEHESVQKL